MALFRLDLQTVIPLTPFYILIISVAFNLVELVAGTILFKHTCNS